MQLARPRQQHFSHFRLLRRNDSRHLRLQNSRFFSGDFPQRMPQEVFMIEIDARDDGNHRRHDVRRVQPATQSHFDHTEFHALPRKYLECQRRHALEVRGVGSQLPLGQQFLDYGLHPRERFREHLIADLFAAHPYALIDALQMR